MSTTILRKYQTDLIRQVFDAWADGHTNVLVQSHTGSGKTVILTSIVEQFNAPAVVIAHRMELVSQLSLSLARAGIEHQILSPKNVVREIINLHLGCGPRHYYNPRAKIVVASVDTLVRRDAVAWLSHIKLVVIDEAAHVLRDNKWGKALAMFPHAKGLLVTATPLRADGRGLGRAYDGVADILIEGPSMRQLIGEGYLSPYRIFAPPNNLDLSTVNVSASGDYSPNPLGIAVKKAQIVGSVVEHYKRHAGGLGITFAVSVEAAHELTAAYNAAGVPAECLHAGISISDRAKMMARFRSGTTVQLVNVDVLAEGVDVPAVNCVSLVRPSLSLSLVRQQIGRALRPAEGKTHAIILDHVGNVTRHGLPDSDIRWTLESKEKRSKGTSTIPLTTCLNLLCLAVFERVKDRCPYCGHPKPAPKIRATPQQVDGDLTELDVGTIKIIQREINRIDGAPRVPHDVSSIVKMSIIKKHDERYDAQKKLRETIAHWAGEWHAAGDSDGEIHRRFYFLFNVDILTAQTLNKKDAENLMSKILTISAPNPILKEGEIGS